MTEGRLTARRIGSAEPGRLRARAVRGAALLTLGACVALGACAPVGGQTGPAQGAAATTSGSSPARTSPPPGPQAPDPAVLVALARAGAPVQSGAVTLTVAAIAAPVGVVVQDDGSVVVTFPVGTPPVVTPAAGSAARRVVAVLAAPSDLGFEARTDRSVTVRGAGGAVVGALPAVAVVDAAGTRVGAELSVRAGDATLLDVLVDAGAGGTATLTFGATPLVSAVWGEREGGRSLAVVPAPWVRAGSLAAQDVLWAALVTAEPDADSPSMHDQLQCHALGAATKASWNLEPWRPQVDSFALLAARCNP